MSISFIISGSRRGSPSRGTPNHLMDSNNQTARVDPQFIPLAEEAARQYEEAGGQLTHFSTFGEDPLAHDANLVYQRQDEFHRRYPVFDPFFSNLVNGDDSLFRKGLLYLIRITNTLHQ